MLQLHKKCFWKMAFLFIALICFLIWMISVLYEKEAQDEPSVEVKMKIEDSILQFRTARQQLRSMEKAQLNSVAHDTDSDEDLQAMAKRQLLRLCEREEKELTLEGLLELRGWGKNVVTVGEDSVNVLIATDLITQHESSVILEMVCRETGVMSGNVKIIPIN